MLTVTSGSEVRGYASLRGAAGDVLFSASANAEDDSGAERTIPVHKFLIWVPLVVESVSILLAGNRFTTRFETHGELRVALGTNA